MPYYNEVAGIVTLTGNDEKIYKYTFQPGTILLSDHDNLLSFNINGKDYHYKGWQDNIEAAADVIKHGNAIAKWGKRGAAGGVTGIAIGAALSTAYEIQQHFKHHPNSGFHTKHGYYNNGHFMFYGPAKWVN